MLVRVYLLAGNITGPNAAGNAVSSAGPLLARVIDTRTGGSGPALTVTVYMVGGNVRVEEGRSTRAAKSSTSAIGATSPSQASPTALAGAATTPAIFAALAAHAEKELVR